MLTPNYSAKDSPIVIEIKKRSTKLSSLSLYNLSILNILSFIEDEMEIEKAEIICVEENGEDLINYEYGPGVNMEVFKDIIIDKLAYNIISIEAIFKEGVSLECNAVDEFYLDYNPQFDIDKFIKSIFKEHIASYINPSWVFVDSICFVVEDHTLRYYQSLSHYINRDTAMASSS